VEKGEKGMGSVSIPYRHVINRRIPRRKDFASYVSIPYRHVINSSEVVEQKLGYRFQSPIGT